MSGNWPIYPLQPGQAMEIGTGSGRKLSLAQLKQTGQSVTIEELLEVMVSEPKGWASEAQGKSFHIDEFYRRIAAEIRRGRIEQLAYNAFRVVPDHPDVDTYHDY